MTTAQLIQKSVNPDGKMIATVEVKAPLVIWAEVLTHCMLSRNAQSNRACGVLKQLERIAQDMFFPIWTKCTEDFKGMQGEEGSFSQEEIAELNEKHLEIFEYMKEQVLWFKSKHVHKQNANRYLHPFQYITAIITATEWDNFFELRCHSAAQPEIRELAELMRTEVLKSCSVKLNWGEWHLPYVDYDLLHRAHVSPYEAGNIPTDMAKVASVASVARVSFNNHDGTERTYSKDEGLHKRLVKEKHASPFEHQAQAMRGRFYKLDGFCSYRYELENPRG